MSYAIRIGETEVAEGRDHVERVELSEAPSFPNDGLTGGSNERCPSYAAWSEFAREVGLHAFFFDRRAGLMREHPGCFPFGERHLWIVEKALEDRRAMKTMPPGFPGLPRQLPDGSWVTPDEGRYDPHLARLIWLEWWMRRALSTCRRPGFWNV